MGTQHEARVPVCGVQIPPSPPIIWASRIVAIAAGCKPAVVRLRWFESNLAHQNVSPFKLDTAFNVMVVSSNERGYMVSSIPYQSLSNYDAINSLRYKFRNDIKLKRWLYYEKIKYIGYRISG